MNSLYSYSFEGSTGFKKMQEIMQKFRQPVSTFGNLQVVDCLDYLQGIDSLPTSDVLKFSLENHCSFVVRPSGTEPKLKLYISASAKNREGAVKIENDIVRYAEKQYGLL
jgi:phosphoglucomutase